MTISLTDELLNKDSESFRKIKPLFNWNSEDYIYRVKRVINSIRVKYYNLFPQGWKLFVQNWGWCFWSLLVILLIALVWYVDAYLTFQY